MAKLITFIGIRAFTLGSNWSSKSQGEVRYPKYFDDIRPGNKRRSRHDEGKDTLYLSQTKAFINPN